MQTNRLKLALVLATTLVATGAFAAPAIFAESASVKVRPSHAIRDDRGVDLTAARNEFVSFQVVVHGATSGATGVSATFSGLQGPSTIGADKVVLYREALINVTQASGGTPTTGQWPDGLVPDVDETDKQKRNAFPFSVPANQARAIWVDVHVPKTAAPGDYTGQVVVTGSGFTQQIPVRLKVVNATLPSTASLKSAFLIYSGNVCRMEMGDSECGGNTTRMSQATNRYAELALDHRLTLTNIFKTARQGDNWPAFDAMYSPLLNGTANTRLEGAKLTTAQITSNREVAKYKAWADHFKAKGWFDRLFDYTGDEPPYGITFTEAKNRVLATRSADPQLRTLLTATIKLMKDNGLDQYFDTVVPPINWMDGTGAPYLGNQRAQYDGFLASAPQKEVWLYQSCMSHGCAYGTTAPENAPNKGWPSYMIDRSAAKNRAMQWLVFKYDATAELYYETAMALPTAWNDQFRFSGNGDGTLFYPGTPSIIGGTSTVPLPSIRLKQIRIGMQDYEWLKLVADAGDPAFAKQIVNNLLPSASQVSDDGAAFDTARLALINRYVQLTTPAVKPEEPKPTTTTTTEPGAVAGNVPVLQPTPTINGEEGPVSAGQPATVEEFDLAQGGCSAMPVGPLAFGLVAAFALLRRRRRS